MDEILFGKGMHLADSVFTPEESVKEGHVRDTQATNHLLELSSQGSSGRIFILFLDASHFDYSFPQECALFTPYGEGANYIEALFSKQVPASLVNRYQNALLFVDKEVGRVVQAIDKEAVVVITGDHGEEFYEKGNLFHNSVLTKEQITPPILYRLPKLAENPKCHNTCHMDIFPSLLHYLTGADIGLSILEGQSIFKKQRWPFTVIARFNASRTPTEYCIHKDALKLHISFDPIDPHHAKTMRLLSTKTLEDATIPFSNAALDEEFGQAFDHLFPVQ
jgi:membrane-anchored protein YejM (alkaline phosphatase superfamily)